VDARVTPTTWKNDDTQARPMDGGIFGGAATDGPMAQPGAHPAGKQSAFPALVVFLNKTTMVDARRRSLSFVGTGGKRELLEQL